MIKKEDLQYKIKGALLLTLMLTSCRGIKNTERPLPKENEEGAFVTVRDGLKIFVYEHIPEKEFVITIYVISGITGINHKSDRDIIEKLSNNVNRVVVIHPRGTGYSEGVRGDCKNLNNFIGDYVEIIQSDKFYNYRNNMIVLYSHSMSCAIALAVGNELQKIDALIMVNPPYKLKSVKGMSPGFGDYLRYIAYYIFAPHIPVVNMAGDPAMIEDETDRQESERSNLDPLIVKYFSMRFMNESKKIMDAMIQNAKHANYPLLLLYGENDKLVEKAGCDEIFAVWKNQNKKYTIIKGGSHGKSTAIKGINEILKFLF